MLLKELIATQDGIVTIDPTATVRAVAEAMARANVGCAAVVHANQLVGIVTERDLVRRVIVKELNIHQTQVSEVMSKDVVVGKANDHTGKATRLMRENHIRHLPVVDHEGTLLGVLSVRDLLREEIQDMRDYIGQSEG